MLRPTALIAIALVFAASGCIPSTGGSSQPASTTAAPTTSSTDATPEVTTEITTSSPTAPTSSAGVTTDSSESASGEAVELAQYGLRFNTPPSFQVVDNPEYDFFAQSQSPRGLLSIADCAGCELSFAPREGETHRNIEIDGVPVLVVENAALEGLPSGVTANELIVVDNQRAFSVIMSVEGDIGPPWQGFVESIEFFDI